MSDGTQQNTAVLGVGSPVVDLLVQVSDGQLAEVTHSKGGMELLEAEQMDALLTQLSPCSRSAGGSAANTVFTLAEMGMPTSFLGKLGDDEYGRYYREAFDQVGGDTSRFKTTTGAPTARCVCMITPDSERTMRTHLGAAAELDPGEIRASDFDHVRHVHLEGYLLFNRELLYAVVRTAKQAGCTISMDLGSFEVVRAAHNIMPELLADYVDMVFANEEEAVMYAGTDSPAQALQALAGSCRVAAVKRGREGALLQCDSQYAEVPAIRLDDVVDTTGAGDIWASGFLYGYLNDLPLQVCGEFAAVLGGEAVRQVGAQLADEMWQDARHRLARYWPQ